MRQASQQPPAVDQLRAAFPDHLITEDRRRTPPRYIAAARNLTTRPSCLITPDLAELGRELAAARSPR